MQKKLGIDIDGVLTHEGGDKNNIWQKHLSNFLGYDIQRKKDAFDFTEAYGLSDDIIKKFVEHKSKEIYTKVKPAPDSRQVIQALKKRGYCIYIITARDLKYHKLTKNWLKKHDIPYDNLHHRKNKLPLIQKENIPLFIEDNKKNILQLSQNNITVIIKDRYHNRMIKEENSSLLYRADNWQQIKELIYDFFNDYPENCCSQ